MKVVLFCGGLGLRMRSAETSAPKPMMPIGSRPVLWHVMRYYAHFGHTDFILALGYGALSVKEYFLHYDETTSNDFTLDKGGKEIVPHSSDIADWRITFVDTGLETAIGERLRRVRRFLDDDDVFLANYGDVLTDAPLDHMVSSFLADDALGSLLAVKPTDSFHAVSLGDNNRVDGFLTADELPLRINGGYFVLRQRVFDYLNEGEDLVAHALARIAAEGRLRAFEHRGFWAPMDTLKERSMLERLYHSGESPWTLWRGGGNGSLSGPRALEVPDLDRTP
jgi:glucose-1-phosphate cytidylyltransferase